MPADAQVAAPVRDGIAPLSNNVTLAPAWASLQAVPSPATPPPTTAIFLRFDDVIDRS